MSKSQESIELNKLSAEAREFYSHTYEIKRITNRLLFDSYYNIINSEMYKKVKTKIISLPIDKRASIVYKLHRILKSLVYSLEINEFAKEFRIDYIHNYKETFHDVELISILYEFNHILIDDIPTMIGNRMYKTMTISIDPELNYFKGTTPIKTSKYYFYIRKEEKNPKIEKKDISQFINIKERKIDLKNSKIPSPENANKFIFNKLKKEHKFRTILHLNNKISTWRIIAERKCNLIIQWDYLKYDNAGIGGNILRDGDRLLITNGIFNSYSDIITFYKTYDNQYKGLNFPGYLLNVIEEDFGYYITSLIEDKASKIGLDVDEIDALKWIYVPEKFSFVKNKEIKYITDEKFKEYVYPDIQGQEDIGSLYFTIRTKEETGIITKEERKTDLEMINEIAENIYMDELNDPDNDIKT